MKSMNLIVTIVTTGLWADNPDSKLADICLIPVSESFISFDRFLPFEITIINGPRKYTGAEYSQHSVITPRRWVMTEDKAKENLLGFLDYVGAEQYNLICLNQYYVEGFLRKFLGNADYEKRFCSRSLDILSLINFFRKESDIRNDSFAILASRVHEVIYTNRDNCYLLQKMLRKLLKLKGGELD